MSDIIQRMTERVLLCDGAIGSQVQAADLDIDTDFAGQENCSEVLNRSRPDFVLALHRSYLEAGADGLLIETVQDPLQLKAAVNGARLAFRRLGREVPILGQVTIETTGTLLVGTDIAAAATIGHAIGLDAFGLNCATGPHEMAEHVRWIGENWAGPITVQPNAGLPELVDGEVHYPLSPDEMAAWLKRFVSEDGINMVGGCCGTTTAHVRAFDSMLRNLNGGARPVPPARKPEWVPGVASLYGQVAYRQENAYFTIGERCNANGSKKFRELQAAEDWDGCIAIGREQAREGSHTLDICTAFVSRDEVADMSEMVSRRRIGWAWRGASAPA